MLHGVWCGAGHRGPAGHREEWWLTGRALLFDRGQRHDGRVGVQEALEGGMSEPAIEFAIVDHSDKAWLDPPNPCR